MEATAKSDLSPSPVSLKKPGLRERSKKERKRRIVAAAREQFIRYGYDEATVRGIADAADVSVGTLFNYASHKRDLMFLIFNEEIDQVISSALALTGPRKSYRENILHITNPHFRLFGLEPTLSRILLSEILTETQGLNLARYPGIRLRLLNAIEGLVAAAQETGEIVVQRSPEIIAIATFVSFTGALRWWLMGPNPDYQQGQRDYAEILDMLLQGLTHAE